MQSTDYQAQYQAYTTAVEQRLHVAPPPCCCSS